MSIQDFQNVVFTICIVIFALAGSSVVFSLADILRAKGEQLKAVARWTDKRAAELLPIGSNAQVALLALSNLAKTHIDEPTDPLIQVIWKLQKGKVSPEEVVKQTGNVLHTVQGLLDGVYTDEGPVLSPQDLIKDVKSLVPDKPEPKGG